MRFRALLSDEDWQDLPPDVQRRFTKRLAGGRTAVYVGRITKVHANLPGKLLSQILRLIGGPLPLFDDVDVPSVVTVTEDVETGGQIWTRLYANRTGFPQVIHSAKRFAGPTGLEEYIGFGISMALDVTVEDRVLTFRSAGYYLRLGPLRLRVPRWLAPGALNVIHREEGGQSFVFGLTLDHPLFGRLVHQEGLYREEMP
ncbi:DUF4166 domain-containing protein [Hoeflea sp. TYP-13]|uniref:DUF4166 domain-containing protein n=1 Tax=Hoeflea sp. TYP-13 TaxID=3230023 RepID=UPI0034C5F923